MSHPFFYVHGWATNEHIWPNYLSNESTYYYGAQDFPNFTHLCTVFLDYVEKQCQPVTVVGWSLGGMLAIQLAAAYPDKINHLILVGSTARFTAHAEYTAGLSPVIVKRLAKKLQSDALHTRLEFYQLMFSATEQQYIKSFLCEIAPKMADLTVETLSKGLNYLLDTDLRPLLSTVQVQCSVIHGSQDAICPVEAGHYLADNLPHARLVLIPEAGHIPFYTAPAIFQTLVEESV